jgi:hypothetical protein
MKIYLDTTTTHSLVTRSFFVMAKPTDTMFSDVSSDFSFSSSSPDDSNHVWYSQSSSVFDSLSESSHEDHDVHHSPPSTRFSVVGMEMSGFYFYEHEELPTIASSPTSTHVVNPFRLRRQKLSWREKMLQRICTPEHPAPHASPPPRK